MIHLNTQDIVKKMAGRTKQGHFEYITDCLICLILINTNYVKYYGEIILPSRFINYTSMFEHSANHQTSHIMIKSH